jgi:hypothetical protein
VIVDAAAHERLLVAMTAVELLQALSARWPALVSRAIERLISSPKAHARFAAMCATTKHADPDVLRATIRRGLLDKSGRVRWKAADRAERLELRDLLPDIERALSVEKNAKTRSTIAYHQQMLRDGYIAKTQADGGISLWVRTANGSTGSFFEAEVVRERGIEAIVAELRHGEQ